MSLEDIRCSVTLGIMIVPWRGEDGNVYELDALKQTLEAKKPYPLNPSRKIHAAIFSDPDRRCRLTCKLIEKYVATHPDAPETLQYLETKHGPNFLNYLYEQNRYELAAARGHGPSMLVLADKDPAWLQKAYEQKVLTFDGLLAEMHAREDYGGAAELGYMPSMVKLALREESPTKRRRLLLKAHREKYDPATLELAKTAATPEEAVKYYQQLQCLRPLSLHSL